MRHGLPAGCFVRLQNGHAGGAERILDGVGHAISRCKQRGGGRLIGVKQRFEGFSRCDYDVARIDLTGIHEGEDAIVLENLGAGDLTRNDLLEYRL